MILALLATISLAQAHHAVEGYFGAEGGLRHIYGCHTRSHHRWRCFARADMLALDPTRALATVSLDASVHLTIYRTRHGLCAQADEYEGAVCP